MLTIIMLVQLSLVALIYVTFKQGQRFGEKLKNFEALRECDFEFFKALETEINRRDGRADFKAQGLRLGQEKGGLLYVPKHNLDADRRRLKSHAPHS